MYIESLKVTNFRSLKDFKIAFNKGYNLLIGKNNTDKSNVLKALNKIINKQAKFSRNDTSTINNASRKSPHFSLRTNTDSFEKRNKDYYRNNNRIAYETFENHIKKINLIHINIQKEYQGIVELLIKQYGDLDESIKGVFESQINID